MNPRESRFRRVMKLRKKLRASLLDAEHQQCPEVVKRFSGASKESVVGRRKGGENPLSGEGEDKWNK